MDGPNCLCGFGEWCDNCRPSFEPSEPKSLKEYGGCVTFTDDELRFEWPDDVRDLLRRPHGT